MFDPQAFWTFSLQQYSKSNVQPLMLKAQNQYGININLALLCHWMDVQMLSLTDSQLTSLAKIAASVSQSYTQPLRALRTTLKQQWINQGLDDADYNQLKSSLLDTELQFERFEQQELIHALNALLPEPISGSRVVLSRYLSMHDIPVSIQSELLDFLNNY